MAFSMSPGKDFRFHESDDYQTLADKLWHAVEWGCTHLALLMDDIPRTLSEVDLEQFNTLGNAQSHLV